MENLFLAQIVRELSTELSLEVPGLRVERVSGLAPMSILIELAAQRVDSSPGRSDPASGDVTPRVDSNPGRSDPASGDVTPRSVQRSSPAMAAASCSDPSYDSSPPEREHRLPAHKLVICLDAALPCLLAIDEPLPVVPAAKNPDGFIRALSDILKGTVLAHVEQHGRDRVARLLFRRRADNTENVMWVELFGRRPVAALVEGATRTVLACSHEGVRSASGEILHTGATYRPPVEKNKAAVENLSWESLLSWTEEKSEEELSVRLSRRIEGLSPNAALEILESVGTRPEQGLLEELKRRLAHSEQYFTAAVRTPAVPESQRRDSVSPRLPEAPQPPESTRSENSQNSDHVRSGRFDLALFPFGAAVFARDPRYKVERFDTALEAVRHSFVQLCHWYRQQASRRLRSDASAIRGRLEKLRATLADDMASAEQGDRYRRTGELILANIKTIPRGADTVELRDIHGEGEEVHQVMLDPALSPSENADKYFKKARKAKRAREVLEKRIGDTEHRARAIDGFVSGLQDNIGPTDLARLRQRLETLAGAGKKRAAIEFGSLSEGSARPGSSAARGRSAAGRGTLHKHVSTAPGRSMFNPRVFATSEGYSVIVGRNNRENDYVTHRLAKPEDLWFHAYGVTGSHVVLRQRGKDAPSRRAIEETASIAAYYSKAKTSSSVPVIYTQKKFVNKPRGARPGTATCAREKMVMARPVKPKVQETG